jgi:hypothetical protein
MDRDTLELLLVDIYYNSDLLFAFSRQKPIDPKTPALKNRLEAAFKAIQNRRANIPAKG